MLDSRDTEQAYQPEMLNAERHQKVRRRHTLQCPQGRRFSLVGARRRATLSTIWKGWAGEWCGLGHWSLHGAHRTRSMLSTSRSLWYSMLRSLSGAGHEAFNNFSEFDVWANLLSAHHLPAGFLADFADAFLVWLFHVLEC